MARAFRISPDSSVPIRSASCRTWIFSASVTAAEILASRLSGITTGPRATNSTRQSATRRLCTPTSRAGDHGYTSGLSCDFFGVTLNSWPSTLTSFSRFPVVMLSPFLAFRTAFLLTPARSASSWIVIRSRGFREKYSRKNSSYFMALFSRKKEKK